MRPVPASANSSTFDLSFLPFTIYNMQLCMSSPSGSYTILGFGITSSLLVLPSCLLVLCQALRRCREQRSNTLISNFHLFTYHLAAIEIMGISGHIIFFCGTKTDLPMLMTLGIVIFLITSAGQMFFHLLTSVERYLAVIHPITYRSLREARVIIVRNVTIGLSWALSLSTPLFTLVKGPVPIFFSTAIVSLYFIVFLFLSLSVVCALPDKGPKREMGTPGRSGQKLRAFHTILVILGVLFVRFTGHLGLALFIIFSLLGKTVPCGFILSEFWFGLPSSLVLPLLFLHKAGKLQCCKRHN